MRSGAIYSASDLSALSIKELVRLLLGHRVRGVELCHFGVARTSPLNSNYGATLTLPLASHQEAKGVRAVVTTSSSSSGGRWLTAHGHVTADEWVNTLVCCVAFSMESHRS